VLCASNSVDSRTGGCKVAASCWSRDQLYISYVRGCRPISPPLAKKILTEEDVEYRTRRELLESALSLCATQRV